MSKADQAAVRDKHKQVGKTAKGRGKNAKNPAVLSVKVIKAMKAKMKAQTITVYTMREKFEVETDDSVTDDEGGSFGVRK